MPRASRIRCLPALLSSLRFLVLIGLSCVTIAIPSSAQTLTTLVNFDGVTGNGPIGGMIQGADGNFYGTTNDGGLIGGSKCYGNGCGTVFKMTPAGALTTLYVFCPQSGCPDGAYPQASLAVGPDGNFYGTTVGGGSTGSACGQQGCGTVFKITPSGTLTVLHQFCSAPNCADGSNPVAGLVLASDGNFYGATFGGGSGYGVLYKVAPNGTVSTFYNFCSLQNCVDGESPYGSLIQAADGNLYGTTQNGGSTNQGTVFKISSNGMLKTLHSFSGNDGSYPQAGLVQAIDGNFYGTTEVGGIVNDNCTPSGCGTIFKITPGGTLTTLHRFNGSDGSIIISGLTQATDGNLYGGTWWQGPNHCGTLFDVTPGSIFNIVHNFNCYDGRSGSWERPVQSTDGNLYGTSADGGSSNLGTVFRLNVGLAPFVQVRPSSGIVGTPVTLFGSYLTGATSVSFNGTPAAFNVVSPTEITTTVPSGKTTGTIQVSVPGNTLLSNTNFRVGGPLQFVPWSPCRVSTRARNTGNRFRGARPRTLTSPIRIPAASPPAPQRIR